MANRLTRIYTRSGDKGTTSLASGERISKSSPRIDTLGDIDELNSSIGLLLTALAGDDPLLPMLAQIQHDLFDLGGEIAVGDPNYQALSTKRVTELEAQLDQLNAQLPPLKEFILPGGNVAAAQCHVARSVCRRAERKIVLLCETESIDLVGAIYLNRLSDLLFVCARTLARRNNGEEVYWQPSARR